jgi:hypothetical protein
MPQSVLKATDVDWERFRQRVPAGTHIDYYGERGLLLQNVQHDQLDTAHTSYPGLKLFEKRWASLSVQFFEDPPDWVFRLHIPLMKYWIEDRWQSLEEVMAS